MKERARVFARVPSACWVPLRLKYECARHEGAPRAWVRAVGEEDQLLP